MPRRNITQRGQYRTERKEKREGARRVRLSECRAALGLGVKRTPLSDLGGEEGKEAAVAVAMGGRQGGSERGQVPDEDKLILLLIGKWNKLAVLPLANSTSQSH